MLHAGPQRRLGHHFPFVTSIRSYGWRRLWARPLRIGRHTGIEDQSISSILDRKIFAPPANGVIGMAPLDLTLISARPDFGPELLVSLLGVRVRFGVKFFEIRDTGAGVVRSGEPIWQQCVACDSRKNRAGAHIINCRKTNLDGLI